MRETRVKVRDITARILCEHHNNSTNELDTEGGRLADALRRYFDIGAERRFMQQLRWKMEVHDVDGPKIERWFMKTAINLEVGYPEPERLPIGGPDAPPNSPTQELVEMVYGQRSVTPPYGMWAIQPRDGMVEMNGALNHWSWSCDTFVCGHVFSITGQHFAISLCAEEPPWEFIREKCNWNDIRWSQPFLGVSTPTMGVGIRVRWP